MLNMTFAESGRSLMDRLTGVSRVSWADEQAVLGWQYPLPAWVWAVIVLSALVFACWSYSRLLGPRPARMALGVVRSLLIVLVAALLIGPMLVRPDERVEPDTLLVLLDRSASMQIRDTPDVSNGSQWLCRDMAMRRALHRQMDVFGEQGLARERSLTWLGFGEETFAFEPALDEPDEWPEANRPGTNIRTAIEQALAAAGGRPISGIVIFSDGRSPQATGAELVHRLQQQAVSVYSVPLGADPMPTDLRLGRIDHPDQAFVDDIVPVTVRVEKFGGEGEIDPSRVRVRLIDTATDEVMDERTLEEGGLDQPVRLRAGSDTPGQARWRVELEHDSPDAAPPLLDRRQRQTLLTVEILDRPLRVLYVEGYPRWEYRYLAAMLVREDSIESSMLLLSADRGFAQEGDRPITRFPQDREEMSEFDVIVLGDAPPDYFSSDQINLIRDHVSEGGAGLLWIGGERFTPVAYERTALADLLPMQRPGNVTALPSPTQGFVLIPTLQARALNVLELSGPELVQSRMQISDAAADELDRLLSDFPDWPRALPPLRWGQEIRPLKPTAERLAVAYDPEAQTSDPPPLLARLRYGAGQSLYVATDEVWRWRYGRGELYFEQFWIQLVRMLGRERVQQTDDRAQLTVSSRRAQIDQSVVVELHLDDPALLERELATVSATVNDLSDDERAIDQLELRPTGNDGAGSGRRTYRASWRPTRAGPMELRVTDPALDDLELAAAVEVIAPDDEMRRPEPNHARLASLSEQTGGEVVPLDELERLTELVPNRARRTAEDVRDPLWHSPLALGLILLLLTTEWILRKAIRLV
ncbi:hypothetical protein ACERK3_09175 [Phycisphaerales bacterium AB-hyl4]|uniref:VWFA domain-containing protein n=1 Tax=Natronomicrosphaera hydrolytica TaxID=3242702 RepID=A0ABV4U5L8_9BACT